MRGKLVTGVGSQYSHTTSECGVSSITNADEHTSAASSRLNWRPRRLKWTRLFRRKTKSGFCACAITFQTHYRTLACDNPGIGNCPSRESPEKPVLLLSYPFLLRQLSQNLQ